jgi:hypothetical protein
MIPLTVTVTGQPSHPSWYERIAGATSLKRIYVPRLNQMVHWQRSILARVIGIRDRDRWMTSTNQEPLNGKSLGMGRIWTVEWIGEG